ncbi:MAG: DUF362 domain-containing protein [Abditibacteriota bacterium]|nr:DUF362 domain-containing protein [Abditibacteriota bacterium]
MKSIYLIISLVVIGALVYFVGVGMKNNAIASTEITNEKAMTQQQPVVYFTKDISPEGLDRVYKALNKKATGKVGVKISTGEPGGHNFLNPALIEGLVKSVNGTIVECCTAYGGKRADPQSHKQVAQDHGFGFAPVDIMDENGSTKLPITDGKHLKFDIVGKNFNKYGTYLVLSHFKGHAMGGFGGAIKNISIGIASSDGKAYIHSAGKYEKVGQGNHFGAKQDDFLESMAEAAKAVADHRAGRMIYINVMNNLSVDCDCDSHPAPPEMVDVGILASLDPVALDKACVDLVYKAPDGKALIERMESRHGIHTLDYAEEIGLGSQNYKLVELK